MNTSEKINNTIEEIKTVLERHTDKEEAQKALVKLDDLLEKRVKDKKEE